MEDEYGGVMRGDFEDDEPNVFVNHRGNERRNPMRNKERVDSNMGSIKMNIPQFQGKNDPDLYLE